MAICSQAEIQMLEKAFGAPLPGEYKRLLLGEYPQVEEHMVGSDFDMRYLPDLKGSAANLLDECGDPFVLGEKDFVFIMHQGYTFLYTSCNGSDDPPVYSYLEDNPAPRREFDHFSEWIALCRREIEQGQFT